MKLLENVRQHGFGCAVTYFNLRGTGTSRLFFGNPRPRHGPGGLGSYPISPWALASLGERDEMRLTGAESRASSFLPPSLSLHLFRRQLLRTVSGCGGGRHRRIVDDSLSGQFALTTRRGRGALVNAGFMMEGQLHLTLPLAHC